MYQNGLEAQTELPEEVTNPIRNYIDTQNV